MCANFTLTKKKPIMGRANFSLARVQADRLYVICVIEYLVFVFFFPCKPCRQAQALKYARFSFLKLSRSSNSLHLFYAPWTHDYWVLVIVNVVF